MSDASGTSSAPVLIRLQKVGKAYYRGRETIEVLKDLDLEMPEGAFEALMGPSGSGKSTLLNLIAGLDSPTSGTILVSGEDLGRMNEAERAKWRSQNVGFIFQTYNLLPVLSAVENVELPLVVSGFGANKARERAIAALERVGLADKASSRPSQLSGGQRQRVTIARSLVNDPAIVWADEPTGALDSKTANDIVTLMEELNAEHGQTFVLVTHDASIGKRCHRLVHMSDGEIVGEERNRG
jgi:putative ABC transport system ATP-binding protein